MNKLVYTVFKTIALSIIFIFLFDIAFYMYRVTSLNARMESVSTSLKKVVMENNYLPPEVASTYSEIFKHMICDFNNVAYHSGMTGTDLIGGGTASQNVDGTNGNSVNSAAFIAGMHWNYSSPPSGASHLSITANKQKWNGSWQSVTEDIVRTQMNQPADYGDVMLIQLRVGVFQPIWGWTQANGVYQYGSLSADDRTVNNWVRNAASTELVYSYYVPCLNFRTITSD